jgi:ATP:ADP antiporter, AAA family
VAHIDQLPRNALRQRVHALIIHAAACNIRPGEGVAFALLFIHSFALGASLVFLETPANALFLQQFSAAIVPYVYMLTAVITALLGYGYARLEARLAPAQLLMATLTFFMVGTGLLYGALWCSNAKWLAMGLLVWKDVQWVLADMEFWALAGRLFNVRQGKRLFGLIGTGEVIASIVGGFSVPLVVQTTGTLNLLLLSVVSMVAALGVLLYTIRRFADRFVPSQSQPEHHKETRPLPQLFQERYIGLFFSLSILAIIGFFFIDYVFYDQAASAFPDKDALASFFGVFFAVLGLVELTSKACVSGPLLMRYGLSFGLLALPVINTLTTGVAIATSMLFGSTGLFLWVVVGLKLVDEGLRNSMQTLTFRLLYQPLPESKRLRIQALRESIVEPTFIGFSGALLLFLTSTLAFKALHLLVIVFVILLACIGISVLLRQEYMRTLMQALEKKQLRELFISPRDSASMQVLQAGLRSPNASVVFHGLRFLVDNDHPALESFLVELLHHPEQRVRLHALEHLAQRRSASALAVVSTLAAHDPSASVRGSALRTLCTIGEAEAVDTVLPYLADPAPEVRKGVLIGLLKSGSIDGMLTAGTALHQLLEAPDAAERKLVALVLGEVGIFNFYQPLLKLLRDSHVEVQIAALEAAGKVKHVKLVPLMLEHLLQPHVRTVAFSALTQFGADAIPVLEMVFTNAEQPPAVRSRMAQICGRIGGDKALSMLKRHLDVADKSMYSHVLSSLALCKYQASEVERPQIEAAITAEVEAAAWALAAAADLGTEAITAVLRRALFQEVHKNQEHLLFLLSFVYDAEPILHARSTLTSTLPEKRANALEMLDTLITQPLRSLVFPLLDDIATDERRMRLAALFPQPRLEPGARLGDIINGSAKRVTSWTKACALHVVGKLRVPGLRDCLVAALSEPDPVVRETAAWALSELDPASYVGCAERVTAGPRRCRLPYDGVAPQRLAIELHTSQVSRLHNMIATRQEEHPSC